MSTLFLFSADIYDPERSILGEIVAVMVSVMIFPVPQLVLSCPHFSISFSMAVHHFLEIGGTSHCVVCASRTGEGPLGRRRAYPGDEHHAKAKATGMMKRLSMGVSSVKVIVDFLDRL